MASTTPEVKLEATPEAATEFRVEEKIFVASQWQLMWWRFRRHKMAIFGGIVMILFYLVALFWEFLAPYDPLRYDVKYSFVPPQTIHLWDEKGLRSPFVYGLKPSRDPETLAMVFKLDPEKRQPLKFFVHGDKYKFWGLFEADLHLYGLDSNEQVVFVLGSDRLGRDMVSRIFCGTRISTTIGLVGVFMSLILGILIGGISGFYGGAADTIIQRVIEFLRSVPTIPLWMGLSAAVPSNWPPVRVYFAITVILSLIGWTGHGARGARQVPGDARRGFRHGRQVGGLLGDAHHRAAHGALLPESHHRLGDHGHSRHDPGRDQPQLSGTGYAPAGDQLGRALAGGAKLAGCSAGALAAPARRVRDCLGARFQLFRGWRARCRRSLLQIDQFVVAPSGAFYSLNGSDGASLWRAYYKRRFGKSATLTII